MKTALDIHDPFSTGDVLPDRLLLSTNFHGYILSASITSQIVFVLGRKSIHILNIFNANEIPILIFCFSDLERTIRGSALSDLSLKPLFNSERRSLLLCENVAGQPYLNAIYREAPEILYARLSGWKIPRAQQF